MPDETPDHDLRSPADPETAPRSGPRVEPAAGAADGGGEVCVTTGLHLFWLPLAGRRVRDARAAVNSHVDEAIHEIHPEAYALLEGVRVDEDTVLEAGQHLAFVRPAGEMGA